MKDNKKTNFDSLNEQRDKQLKQKEDQVKTVINSIKNKPKFVRLLDYALNSIDALLTPPNRDIKLNSKIIIQEEGVESLRLVTQMNIANDDIIHKVGVIIKKLIGGDTVDKEMVQQLVNKGCDELITEVILTKEHNASSKIYVELLNTISSVPKVLPDLINKGIVESTKLINDLYEDSPQILEINADTIKKISNNKVGREAMVKKNMLNNIVNKTEKMTENNNEEVAIIKNLEIIDNMTRTEEGLKELKEEKNLQKMYNICDKMNNNEEIQQLGAKILSKVQTKSNLEEAINNLKNNDLGDLTQENNIKKIEKDIYIISNLLPLDTNNLLIKENIDYFTTLLNDFNSKFILNNENSNYSYVLTCFKYILKLFDKITYKTDILQSVLNKGLHINSLIENLISFWNYFQKMEFKSSPLFSSFQEIFNLTVNLLLKSSEVNKNGNKDSIRIEKDMINQLLSFSRSLPKNIIEYDKISLGLSKIYLRASMLNKNIVESNSLVCERNDETKELSEKIDTCEYSEIMNNILNISVNQETITNITNAILLNSQIQNDFTYSSQFLMSMLRNLNEKFKSKEIVYAILRYIENFVSDANFNSFIENIKIQKNTLFSNIDIISSITKAITQNTFGSFNEIETISIYTKKDNLNSKENSIDQMILVTGGKILENILKEEDLLKLILAFNKFCLEYKSENFNHETLDQLESFLKQFICISQVDKYIHIILSKLLSPLIQVIRKELSYYELIKGKVNNSKEDLQKVNLSTKRLFAYIGLLIKIDNKCQLLHISTTSNIDSQIVYSESTISIIGICIDSFSKIENNNLNEVLVHHLIKSSTIILDNIIKYQRIDDSQSYNILEDSLFEKIIIEFMYYLRKNLDLSNNKLNLIIIESIVQYISKCPELINSFVKNGLISILYMILDIEGNMEIKNNCLLLFKKITESNQTNLKILSDQKLLSKLHNFSIKNTDSTLLKNIEYLVETLIKIPSNETQIKHIYNDLKNEVGSIEIIINNHNLNDFNDLNNSDKLFNFLQRLNLLTIEKDYNLNIFEIFNDSNLTKFCDVMSSICLLDENLSKNDELLSKCMLFANKVFNYYDKVNNHTGKKNLIKSILPFINIAKNQNEDVLKSACNLLSTYIESSNFKVDLMFDETLPQLIFEITENYLDDSELLLSANKALSNLSLSDEKLSKIIYDKVGLKNIIQDLKYLSIVESDGLKEKRLTCLILIERWLDNKDNIELFVNSNGIEILDNILNNEISKVKKDKNLILEPDHNKFLILETTYQVSDMTSLEKVLPVILSFYSKISQALLELNSSIVNTLITIGYLLYPNYKIISANFDFFKLLVKTNNSAIKKVLNSQSTSIIQQLVSFLFYYSKHLQTNNESVIENNESNIRMTTSNILPTSSDKQVNIINKHQLQIEENQYLTILEFISDIQISEAADSIGSLCKLIINNYSGDEVLTQYDFRNIKLLERFIIFLSYVVDNNIYHIRDDVLNLTYVFEFIKQTYKKIDFSYLSQIGNAMYIKLISNIHNLLGNPACDLCEYNMSEKFVDIIEPYYNPQNSNFINLIKESLDNITNIESTYLNDNEIITNYYTFLINKSSYFMTYIFNRLTSVDSLSNYKDMIGFIKESTMKFYSLEDQKDKDEMIIELSELNLGFINNSLLTVEDKIPFWEMQIEIEKNDVNNLILKDDVVSTSLLSLIKKQYGNNKEINSNESIKLNNLLDTYVSLLSVKSISNNSIIGEIIDCIELRINDTCVDEHHSLITPLKNISKTLLGAKLIIKNKLIMKVIEEELSNTNPNPIVNEIISDLLSNETNSINILQSNEEIFNLIIKSPSNFKSEHIITKLLSNKLLCSKLKEKEILSEDSLNRILNESPEIINKSEIKDMINKIQEEYNNEKEIKHLEKEAKSIENIVTGYFKTEITNMKKEAELKIKSNASNNRMSNVRCSNIRQSLLPNTRFSKLSISNMNLFPIQNDKLSNSQISSKQNNEISILIDKTLNQLLSTLSLLENETDDDNKIKLTNIINSFLLTLRQLSFHSDNHQEIIEMGFCDIINSIINNPFLKINFYTDVIEILKLLTLSLNSIDTFIKSPSATIILKEFIELLTNNDNYSNELGKTLYSLNELFNNLCRSKKGFEFIFEKIGIEPLLILSKKTNSVQILSALQSTILNFIIEDKNKFIGMIKDISEFNAKCSQLPNKTSIILNDCFLLAGNLIGLFKNEKERKNSNLNKQRLSSNSSKISIEKNYFYDPKISKAHSDIIAQAVIEYERLILSNEELFNSLLFFLGKISGENISSLIEIEKSGIMTKIINTFKKGKLNQKPRVSKILEIMGEHQDEVEVVNLFDNIIICENYSLLLANYLVLDNNNNSSFIDKSFVDQIFQLIQSQLSNTINSTEIIINSLNIMDKLSENKQAYNNIIEGSSFINTLIKLLEKEKRNINIVDLCFKNIINCLSNDIEELNKDLIEQIINSLILFQKMYYSKDAILVQINNISHLLIKKYIKSKQEILVLIKLIFISMNIQEDNIELISSALIIVNENLTNNEIIDIIVELYTPVLIRLISILRYNPFITKLVINMINNMINSNPSSIPLFIQFKLLDSVKNIYDIVNTMEFEDEEDKFALHNLLYSLLTKLSTNKKGAHIISQQITENILKDIESTNPNNIDLSLNLINSLLKTSDEVESFIHFGIFKKLNNLLKNGDASRDQITSSLKIIIAILTKDHESTYRAELISDGIKSTLEEILLKNNNSDKKLDFDIKTIMFALNKNNKKLEDINKIQVVDFKLDQSLKQEIKSFVISGKIVKL